VRDEAVATVIGTVIVLGVLVAAMSLYQLNVVPDLKEESEAAHMEDVARNMARFGADLLRQIEREAAAPTSAPVPLQVSTPAFTPDSSMSGTLSFEQDTGAATLTSPSLKVVSRNGTPVFAAGSSGSGSDWQTVQDGETIDDVDEMLGLRVKITDPSPSDGDRLVVQATDANGDFAGEFRVTTQVTAPDLNLTIETLRPPAPGERIFHNHVLSMPQQRWDSDYWIDAMLDLYGFDLVIADAEKPVQLAFQDEGLSAEYKVSYAEQATDGLSTIVGAGVVHPDYETAFDTGTLSYEAQNEYYPDQRLLVEHGALLRSQNDGAAFVVDPPFSAEAGGGQVRIGFDEPSLTGASDAVSGTGTATVETQTDNRRAFGATAGQLNLTLDTEHPSPWAQFLDDELADAGLTSDQCPPSSASSPCQYEIVEGSGEVELRLHGPTATDADPDDPTRDVFLEFQRGALATEVVK